MAVVCNWRTGEGYPSDDASLAEWAWEFLRRNREYRRRWGELNAYAQAFSSASNPACGLMLTYRTYTGEKLAGLMMGGNARERGMSTAVYAARELCESYGVTYPKCPDSAFDVDDQTLFVAACAPLLRGPNPAEVPEGACAVLVDESWTRRQQSAVLAAALERAPCGDETRNQTKLWGSYLLVLDAVDDLGQPSDSGPGLSAEQIEEIRRVTGGELARGETKIVDRWKSAKKLRDDGYRWIAVAQPLN